MELILVLGFYFLTFYAFLPAIISRIFGFRVFLKGKTDREIALTFDDGPDPLYTPKLLDLLKEHDVKATFFVVGENAERYPEIVARIHEEGHVLGIHNYVHHSNWLMRPKTVKRSIHKTSDVIKDITGTRPMYYRPPWGIMNVFDYANLGYLQIVLWTSMFGDWRQKIGAEKLYKRMRRKLKPGQVFLLHDCGSTFGADRDAPANTIAALERILQDGHQLGYRFVGIDQMIELTEHRKKMRKERASSQIAASDRMGKEAQLQVSHVKNNKPTIGPLKKVVVYFWLLYEKLFHLVFRLKPVGDRGYFNYRIRKYAGPPIDLEGDTTLRSGNYVMELHFDNEKLFELGMNSRSPLQIGIKIVREMQHALPDFARALGPAPNGEKVVALYGVSMIHRGSESLGYQTFDLPRGLFSWMTNIYLRILMRVIHPAGNERVREKGQTLSPRMLIMPRDILLNWANETESLRRPNRKSQSTIG
ncbi:MAG: polysaccharide deacetylase family protein [Candidatus Cohnella colombiensis]|uniref:Polysaccharide deacetylase family protein n=1 Tax=Candidatus Cohnella colombiensis TaxID=3121368 RepID=A0AA95JAM2_9BACL|nr:MAG: polysaccharide deacetylase family protein [Cohnella sp.]